MKYKYTNYKDPCSTGREMHTVSRRLAASQKWPNTSDKMQELMTGWSSYNARTLPLPNRSVLCMNLFVNESNHGTGNGAASLHQQSGAIGNEVRKQHPTEPGNFVGQVITWDVDPVCRDVLKALPKDCSLGGRILMWWWSWCDDHDDDDGDDDHDDWNCGATSGLGRTYFNYKKWGWLTMKWIEMVGSAKWLRTCSMIR